MFAVGAYKHSVTISVVVVGSNLAVRHDSGCVSVFSHHGMFAIRANKHSVTLSAVVVCSNLAVRHDGGCVSVFSHHGMFAIGADYGSYLSVCICTVAIIDNHSHSQSHGGRHTSKGQYGHHSAATHKNASHECQWYKLTHQVFHNAA